MALACQVDSYRKTFDGTVVSVEPCPDHADKVLVELDDTVLFPEGGGQPDDHGTLGGKVVDSVQKASGRVLHRVAASIDDFAVGGKVAVEVDWSRRFDHMQQHSGQHLFTAITDREYKYPTVSWYLGAETSYLDLGTKKATNEELYRVQDLVNDAIRDRKAMTPKLVERDSPELASVRSKGMPDGTEPVRVVTIDGIDSNMCCGTHVSNLSDLQVFQVLYSEVVKAITRVHFVVGNRATSLMRKMIDRERALTKILAVAPTEHAAFVERQKKTLKQQVKSGKTHLKELGKLLGEQAKKSGAAHLHVHRPDGDSDFVGTFVPAAESDTMLLCVTAGAKEGPFNISGPMTLIEAVADDICKLIDGRGAIKGTRYLGKAGNLKKQGKIGAILKKAVEDAQAQDSSAAVVPAAAAEQPPAADPPA
eukprot:m.156411 g.156411  ORF g.156411 m.156411 type:complete len:421 (+) comp17560_c1_seq3:2436-3698(+)